MKATLALLTVSALLLASCNRTDTTPVVQPPPVDPATMVPAAPVVGQSVELQNVPATVQKATDQLTRIIDPNNADLDPDLRVLLALFRSGASLQTVPGNISSFGQQLTQGFGGQGRVSGQALDSVQAPLPTGTVNIASDGTESRSAAPADGYVLIDTKSNTRLEAKWKVGGAATVFVNSGSRYDFQTGQTQRLQQEVPTNATGSVMVAGKTVAALAFTMTPGDCLNRVGPTALSLNGWAGREADSPAKVKVAYAWTDKEVSLSASALYRTATQQVSADMKVNIAGTTEGRCGNTFAFTPTRADMTATLDIPGYKTDLAIYLRNLSNLTISADTMKAPNPFARIGGSVNASLRLNDKSVMTASGPLADGGDMNLQPGDQVAVQYVRNGQLVTADIDGAIRDLQAVFAAPR